MAKQLSFDDVQKIVAKINAWAGTITWGEIVELGEEVTGKKYSRQTLSDKDDIITAYKVKNARTRTEEKQARSSKRPKSKELLFAEARIRKLQTQNENLASINGQLNEKFIVWAEAARKRGLTEEDLNKGLPKIDRKATKVE